MTTLAAIRRRMLEHDSSLGRTVAISALGTNYVRAAALAVGTIGAGKYAEKWLLRPDTSDTGDRIRFAHDYDSANGQLSHEGAAYADTTAAGEDLEIHEYEPHLLDDAIQQALRTTRFRDVTIIPTDSSGRYPLHELDWIKQPGDILALWRRPVPVLTRNRHFERWTAYQATGALAPDFWTLAGTNATFARSETVRRFQYSLAITPNDADATVAQTPGLLWTGVSSDSLRGETVTGVAWLNTAIASSARVRVTDGAGTTNSSYHSGSGGWEEISAVHTVSAAATTLTVTVAVEENTVAYLDEGYLLLGSLTDGIRRDRIHSGQRTERAGFIQGNTLELISGATGRGAQLVIESQRPYSEFTASRVIDGKADADESGAPLDLIAYGALWRFYGELPGKTPAQERKASSYYRTYKQAAAQHLYIPTDGGVTLPMRTSGRVSARIR